MKTNREALWYKEVGGDFGAFRHSLGCRWEWYDCLHCARFDNPGVFSANRWQGPPSPSIVAARKRAEKGHSIRCKGAAYHKKIAGEKKTIVLHSDEIHQTVTAKDRKKSWLNIYCFRPDQREVMGTSHYDLARSCSTPAWQAVLGISPVTGESTVYNFKRRF